mgnify:CR=1 FL=1
MDKTSRFRIDSYEATEKQQPVTVKKTSEPMLFQSYQLAVGDVMPTAIDFQCLKGNRFGFAYAYMSKVVYVSDAANERVEINFSGGEVVVRGVNLIFIYEALLNRKLVWLKEVNMQLLERYQELRPANDNMAQDVPVIVELILNLV